ncbi:hypothetical protein DSO57_1010778 [Entomophthora muscae]|uniref:Uncharacterized protein n=1 Tax=Entomophthora muscae TaxID=34485 RepID=A0ACC2UG13_9FUNG|nr:hypothetical protein DSO57_1010778 [Entomophthora muscae]
MRCLVVALVAVLGVFSQESNYYANPDFVLTGKELHYSTAELDTGYSKRDFLERWFSSTRQFALQRLTLSMYALEGGAKLGSQLLEHVPRMIKRGMRQVVDSLFGNRRSKYEKMSQRGLQRRTLNLEGRLGRGGLLNYLFVPIVGNDDSQVDLGTVDYFNYFIVIQLPQHQRFKVVFDTGSGDLWVPDLYTCVSASCLKRNRFDSSLSNSLVTTDENFVIPYAGNTRVEGKVVRDRFDIAGVQMPLQAPPDNLFRMGLAGNLPLPLINQTFDGILGMGLRSRIGSPPLDYILSRKRQGRGGQLHGYSVYLAPLRNLDDQDKVGGQVTFGGTNPAHFQRPLTWFPVHGGSRATHWELTLRPVARLGNSNLNILASTALVDTGSPVIGLPYEDAKALNDALGATPDPQSDGQTSLLPCPNIAGSGNSALPIFSFDLVSESGPVTFNLGPTDYAIPDPHQPGFCLSAFVPTTRPNQPGVKFWILGAPFIRSYYSVFDQGMLRIGLAKNKFSP